jgi:L-lactate dehydrogenase complex protein LldE
VIEAFEGYDYVVAPSGSCAGMLKKHYPELFADDPAVERARRGAVGQGPTSWSRSSPT